MRLRCSTLTAYGIEEAVYSVRLCNTLQGATAPLPLRLRCGAAGGLDATLVIDKLLQDHVLALGGTCGTLKECSSCEQPVLFLCQLDAVTSTSSQMTANSDAELPRTTIAGTAAAVFFYKPGTDLLLVDRGDQHQLSSSRAVLVHIGIQAAVCCHA